MEIRIRPARLDELEELARVEHEADRRFGVVGIDVIVDAPHPTAADYVQAQKGGRVLVAELPSGALAGFVRMEIVDETAHLEQVSVLPDHVGHGVGRALVAAAEDLAFRHGHARMTLTTFSDVPWNGPYYQRLGWEVLAEDDLGPQLRAIRDHERASGLEVQPRQAMAKVLSPSGALTL